MTEKPEWWPAGCREDYVKECNCQRCANMLEALDQWREGKTPDGEHRRLGAFGD